MPKPSLKKDSIDNILPIAGRNKSVHTFPKCSSLKVNVIV